MDGSRGRPATDIAPETDFPPEDGAPTTADAAAGAERRDRSEPPGRIERMV